MLNSCKIFSIANFLEIRTVHTVYTFVCTFSFLPCSLPKPVLCCAFSGMMYCIVFLFTVAKYYSIEGVCLTRRPQYIVTLQHPCCSQMVLYFNITIILCVCIIGDRNNNKFNSIQENKTFHIAQ